MDLVYGFLATPSPGADGAVGVLRAPETEGTSFQTGLTDRSLVPHTGGLQSLQAWGHRTPTRQMRLLSRFYAVIETPTGTPVKIDSVQDCRICVRRRGFFPPKTKNVSTVYPEHHRNGRVKSAPSPTGFQGRWVRRGLPASPTPPTRPVRHWGTTGERNRPRPRPPPTHRSPPRPGGEGLAGRRPPLVRRVLVGEGVPTVKESPPQGLRTSIHPQPRLRSPGR